MTAIRKAAASVAVAAAIVFRAYQEPVFVDRSSGIKVLFWSRQIGKSFTMACWIVDRMLTRPGRLITVLSNSRDNGAELNQKIREICEKLGEVIEQDDLSVDLKYENMTFESRIKVAGSVSRVKILAANPRTARGFSGDLILDEFAFHENGAKIWEAAEPILSSNPDYLCLIASTPNGTHNMFYEMVTSGLYPVCKVRRSDAHAQGLKIYHPITREPISPEQARELAIDKRAYDQNYELIWADEASALLTHELVADAEDADTGVICEQEWSPEALRRLLAIPRNLYVGVDVGRHRDITVISCLEKIGSMYYARAILRLEGMRLPAQQRRLMVALRAPAFRACRIDMTGIGLGLCEYTQEQMGRTRVQGINFSSSAPMNPRLKASGRKGETVRVTEAMATELLQVYEDKCMRHPHDMRLREDLRKPERIVTAQGRVSIAASRTKGDHADHFWSFALAVWGAAGRMEFQSSSQGGKGKGGKGRGRATRGAHWRRRIAAMVAPGRAIEFPAQTPLRKAA